MDDLIAVKEIAEAEQLVNSLSSLVGQLGGNNLYGSPGKQISQVDTIDFNLRWYFVSNLRQMLSQAYVEHGIIQTLIDVPVDDAFHPGFEIKTGKLDGEEIEQLLVEAKRYRAVDRIKQAIKWKRLFGGGGLLIITDQNPEAKFNIKSIKQDTPLEFRAVDMWELYFREFLATPELDVGQQLGAGLGNFYDYYGKRVHTSRVIRFDGKEAPSFVRSRLRGWGMSEVERLVRPLNQFLKNQDVIFELLDEAKVDVYKMKGFNTGLLNAQGTAKVAARIQAANQIKNYSNALTMDAEDEYEQKTMTFAGLADILVQIRQDIASELRMPMTKVFGISAAGFNSGEDDIEVYNAMVNSEIRAKCEQELVLVLQILAMKKFGVFCEDMAVNFNPMRILNAKEEEEVKDSQFNRVMSAYQSGLVADAKEAKEAINKASLLPVEIDVNAEAAEPIGGEFNVAGGSKGNAGKKTPSEE